VLTAAVLAWDRQHRIRPLAFAEARACGAAAGLGEDELQRSWHLVEPAGGRRHSAGGAFPPLLRALPGGAAPAWLAARAPGASETAYGLVARNRGRLGRLLPDSLVRRADERISLARRRAPCTPCCP
jgi:hypothetical protein